VCEVLAQYLAAAEGDTVGAGLTGTPLLRVDAKLKVRTHIPNGLRITMIHFVIQLYQKLY
jgi:hypothetical protein